MTRDRLVALALGAPFVCAAVFSAARFFSHAGVVPDAADYAAVSAAVARADGRDAVDAVVVLPPWSLTALESPALAKRLIAGDGPWATLAARYRHVVVVHEPDAAPWERPLPAPEQTERFGHLTVTHHRFAGAAYDFRAHVDDAAVFVDNLACTEPVRTRGARHGVHCAGLPAGQRVTREWALVTENGSDVVWAPPPAQGALTVRYAAVPVGKRLVLAAGHTRDGADGGSTVRVRVQIDGHEVATVVRAPFFVTEPHRAALAHAFVGELGHTAPGAHDDDTGGFSAVVIDTAAYAGVHDVAFVIDADAGGGDNAFAFDAFIPEEAT